MPLLKFGHRHQAIILRFIGVDDPKFSGESFVYAFVQEIGDFFIVDENQDAAHGLIGFEQMREQVDFGIEILYRISNLRDVF